MSEPDGLLAVGGDLSVERLKLAYEQGIFPWYGEDSPILWWSTDPRLVLYPAALIIGRTLRQRIGKEPFKITFDKAFREVISSCSSINRPNQDGTWIMPEMIEAYIALHKSGHAHSVESWAGNRLVGGLYGVALGKVFFGESMFALESDASKIAFVALTQRLEQKGFEIIDCQQTTAHLVRFGAHEIARSEFMEIISTAATQSDSW